MSHQQKRASNITQITQISQNLSLHLQTPEVTRADSRGNKNEVQLLFFLFYIFSFNNYPYLCSTMSEKNPFAGDVKPSMQRRSQWADYRGRRMYMVTMVIEGRRPLLGEVVGDIATPHGKRSARSRRAPCN